MKPWILCTALLATPQAFADAAVATPTVEVLAKSTTSWDGGNLPAYAEGSPEVLVLKIEIPPGFTLPLHRHPVINAGVLLAGELTVTTEDGSSLHLSAGEAIVEVVDTWHSGRNDGDVPATIIVFYAGIEGLAVTETKTAPGG